MNTAKQNKAIYTESDYIAALRYFGYTEKLAAIIYRARDEKGTLYGLNNLVYNMKLHERQENRA